MSFHENGLRPLMRAGCGTAVRTTDRGQQDHGQQDRARPRPLCSLAVCVRAQCRSDSVAFPEAHFPRLKPWKTREDFPSPRNHRGALLLLTPALTD